MSKFSNKVKRKIFIKKVTNRFVKLISGISKETDEIVPLYTVIWNNIKEGLEYGIDMRYNLFDAEDYMPSIEVDYNEYFNREGSDEELNIVFQALTEELLPNYILKYEDLQLNIGEDDKGTYFEIIFI